MLLCELDKISLPSQAKDGRVPTACYVVLMWLKGISVGNFW